MYIPIIIIITVIIIIIIIIISSSRMIITIIIRGHRNARMAQVWDPAQRRREKTSVPKSRAPVKKTCAEPWV